MREKRQEGDGEEVCVCVEELRKASGKSEEVQVTLYYYGDSVCGQLSSIVT